jgi:hypothetical protein
MRIGHRFMSSCSAVRRRCWIHHRISIGVNRGPDFTITGEELCTGAQAAPGTAWRLRKRRVELPFTRSRGNQVRIGIPARWCRCCSPVSPSFPDRPSTHRPSELGRGRLKVELRVHVGLYQFVLSRVGHLHLPRKLRR